MKRLIEDLDTTKLFIANSKIDTLDNLHKLNNAYNNLKDFLTRLEQVNLEDAIDVRNIKNLKLANELLKLRKRNFEQKKININ